LRLFNRPISKAFLKSSSLVCRICSTPSDKRFSLVFSGLFTSGSTPPVPSQFVFRADGAPGRDTSEVFGQSKHSAGIARRRSSPTIVARFKFSNCRKIPRRWKNVRLFVKRNLLSANFIRQIRLRVEISVRSPCVAAKLFKCTGLRRTSKKKSAPPFPGSPPPGSAANRKSARRCWRGNHRRRDRFLLPFSIHKSAQINAAAPAIALDFPRN